MAWMIDGEVLTERLRGWLESPHGENVYNSGYDDAIWHVLDVIEHMPTLTQPNEPLTVAEVCPHCESEITMEWNVKTLGYKAYCPVCGNRLMLCDECQHGEPGHICDYDSNKDTCRFNRRPPEGETDE